MMQLQSQINWEVLVRTIFTTKVILLPDGVEGLSQVIIKLILLKMY